MIFGEIRALDSIPPIRKVVSIEKTPARYSIPLLSLPVLFSKPNFIIYNTINVVGT